MAADTTEDSGAFESKVEALEGNRGDASVRVWLSQIDLSGKEEQDWRKSAKETVQIYRDYEKRSTRQRGKRFNILYTNVETIVPAIYNSLPIPDVRRRYGDADEVGKTVSQILERCISLSVDTYDFDQQINSDIKDVQLVGRGMSRVRYKPYLQDTGETDETGAPVQAVTYQEVQCEHVSWERFRHGPAVCWDDVPWIAFELFLTREQINALNPDIGPRVELDAAVSDHMDDDDNATLPPDVFKRATVWEIWDKESKKVIFIAEAYKDAPLREVDDPLNLKEFFPVPRPVYAVETSDTLVPIEPYRFYRDQADELDTVTRRISALIRVLKWRGIYAADAQGSGTFTALTKAEDGELVPGSDLLSVAMQTGLDKAIWMMPIDVAAGVLQGLYEQREQIKATIFEITGIADIMRGQTKSTETATAQQIKAQWGSLRIQRQQSEVQRYIRDLFRLKAEIIAEKFEWETLSKMSGVTLPTNAEKQQAQMALQQYQSAQQQAQMMAQQQGGQGQPPQPPQAPPPPQGAQEALSLPSVEDVMAVLRNDALRTYRVDVETDSTIRGDMGDQQQAMASFLEGTGAYWQAVIPAMQAGHMPTDVAVDIYSSFTKQWRLGKTAEDALDRWSKSAAEQAKQPPQPSPEEQAMQAKMQMEQQKNQATLELQKQKLQLDAQAKQAEGQRKMQETAATIQMKQAETAADIQMQREKAQADMTIKAHSAAVGDRVKMRSAGGEVEMPEPEVEGSGLADAIRQAAAELTRALSKPSTITMPDGRSVVIH